MNNKTVIGIIVFFVIIALLLLLPTNSFWGKKKSPGTSESKIEKNESSNDSRKTKAEDQPKEIFKQTTITVTKSGFEPSKAEVSVGEKVVWTNKSGEKATVHSDKHPTHLLFPLLNLGEFQEGSSVQAIFNKPGTYGYHDHLKPQNTGRIVVK